MALACLMSAAPLAADTPPNQNDPCAASSPRDSCGTTGTGQYATYRYGTRWFGNYRGAVEGITAAGYCIDLGFWYPSSAYNYQQQSISGLHNRRGGAVSQTDLNKMAYALAQYGQTSSTAQASAVMLYVHSLMGDAQPGEVDPSVLGTPVVSAFDTISAAATKYAGPYTVKSSGPSAVAPNTTQTVTFSVVSASGATVPDVTWHNTVSGGSGSAKTASDGTETVTYQASKPGKVTVHASASGLASNLPTMYVPTSGASAGSAQRLVYAATQTVSSDATATAALATPTLSTTATPATLTLGSPDSDAITLGGEPAGTNAKLTISAYGPATSAATATCTGTPAFTQSLSAADGKSTAPAFTPTAPGVYAYQLTVAANASATGLTSACGGANETFTVYTQPAVTTTVSAATVSAGSSLTDTVAVTGLANQPATVTSDLYGPFRSTAAISCSGTPVWTGTIPVQADGSYTTSPTTLTTPGYYVYNESIAATGFVKAVTSNCSPTGETTLVSGTPTVTTRASAATASAGSQISDTLVVGGLGVLPATVNVNLYGPYKTESAIDCSGTPVSSTAVTAKGDGTYHSKKVTLPSAGYYVFNESIAATSAYPAVSTPCASAPETVFSPGTPQITTHASDATVKPPTALSDHLSISGLGSTPATVKVDLYGPYASVAQVNCAGKPYAVKTMRVKGDGNYSSPSVTVSKVGFYVFRESIESTATIKGVTTQCADTAETSLSAPAIITGGRGPFPHVAPQASSRPADATPDQIEIPGLNITAPVAPITIDLADQELGVPTDIHRAGWWRDGAAPGAKTGTVLIAGHVDSAAAGEGAFFPLPNARPGMTIEIKTRGGQTIDYKVTGVQRVLKAKLPLSVFDRSGPARLALVTCGGPFDQATGHYLDNIIVWGKRI